MKRFRRNEGKEMGIFGKPNIEKLKEKRDIKGLKKACEHADVWFSAEVALLEIINESEEIREVETIIKILREAYPRAHEEAILALGRIGDKRAIEPLEESLKDEDEDVRKAAKQALNRIQKKLGMIQKKPRREGQGERKERRRKVEAMLEIRMPLRPHGDWQTLLQGWGEMEIVSPGAFHQDFVLKWSEGWTDSNWPFTWSPFSVGEGELGYMVDVGTLETFGKADQEYFIEMLRRNEIEVTKLPAQPWKAIEKSEALERARLRAMEKGLTEKTKDE